MAGIDQLIINSAYREPTHHWKYNLNGQTFVREEGRRPAGYFIAGQGSNQYNDIGQFIELPLVNRIRPRVKAWREVECPGVTGVTRKLLDHWNDKDARQYPFFYCQMDAIETLIWLTEAPDAEKVGIDIPSDGGAFRRLCTKLCTGGGKTTVMAMLIAWMICNKVTYPQDKRFTKYVFIVAEGNLPAVNELAVVVSKKVLAHLDVGAVFADKGGLNVATLSPVRQQLPQDLLPRLRVGRRGVVQLKAQRLRRIPLLPQFLAAADKLQSRQSLFFLGHVPTLHVSS